MDIVKARVAYQRQCWDVKKRGIKMLLTFDEWCAWWQGQLGPSWQTLRGCRRGQFVMARNGDKGPYALWNIKCIKAEENHNETSTNGSANQGERNGTAVLTNQLVKQVFLAKGTNADVARRFNIAPQRVSKIKNRKIWRSVTNKL